MVALNKINYTQTQKVKEFIGSEDIRVIRKNPKSQYSIKKNNEQYIKLLTFTIKKKKTPWNLQFSERQYTQT